MSWLDPIARALAEGDAPVDLFLRDDDAGWADDRLLALLDVVEPLGLPIDLAAIPSAVTPRLAHELALRALSATGRVGVHQHGASHASHEPAGRPCEFGPSRPAAAQLADVARGRELLRGLLGPLVDPVFTPPWNRCTRVTGECLLAAGIGVLSREARAEPLGLPGLAEVPVTVDWLARRRGTPLGRDGLAALLAAGVRAGRIGLMFHHAVMDEAERASAGALLALLAAHPRVRPASIVELGVAAPRSRTPQEVAP